MASAESTGGHDLSWMQGGEPGTRRKKLAGYLKAANEIRQSYWHADGSSTSRRDFSEEHGDVDGPGPFEDAAIVRSGNEEMILFPSYARKHVKRKLQPPPNAGEMSEQEYWSKEWERQENDKALVDVDVRGWIYTPHRGPMNRKQRLALGVARQIAGLPAPAPSQLGESSHSVQDPNRGSNPGFAWKQDEDIIAHEAKKIERQGEYEQRFARRGAFSETPTRAADTTDADSLYNYPSASSSRNNSPDRGRHRLSEVSVASSTGDEASPPRPLQKQYSWNESAKMTNTELTTAHSRLLHRFSPFLANPLIDAPVKAFFYNADTSRERTVHTNPAGHFTCRAALDFVPTHVRILAAERLSATEEVNIIAEKGVSLISDIDDTVKHSGISTNAREIFRNTFIRELGDLTIDGVREWYNTLHDMGVTMHYVSNSPWQLYPILTTYFKMANLPKGSFHLKQYSGMLQGIFEPVAERKKSSLQKIIHDFPDRKFVLVGDSGEADLEVYTDVALENPGRVLGIFIRDVTTPVKTGYFDPSNGIAGSGRSGRPQSQRTNTDGAAMSKRPSRPESTRDDDAELRAAIAASLADLEDKTSRARRSINPDAPFPETMSTLKPSLPPRRPSVRSASQPPGQSKPEEDLIDLSDDPIPSRSYLAPPAREDTPIAGKTNGSVGPRPSPSPPPKPRNLRSPSPGAERTRYIEDSRIKSPPPRPRKPSSAVKPPVPLQTQSPPPPPPPRVRSEVSTTQHQPSPLSQVTVQSPEAKPRPPLPVRKRTQNMLTRSLTGSQNQAPQTPHWSSDATISQSRPPPAMGPRSLSTLSARSMDNMRAATTSKPMAPPPPLRQKTSIPSSSTRQKATNRMSGHWSDGEAGNLPGTPGEPATSKKELAWNQRWARAKGVLDRNGVMLRSWRTGSDVADVCVRLVEHALSDIKGRERRGAVGE